MNIFMPQNIRQFIKGVIQKKQDWDEMTKYRVPCKFDVPAAINIVYEDIFGYKTEGLFVEVGAFNGEDSSFTCHLADIGWTGHYIEPIKKYFLHCSRRHKDNKITCHNYFIGTATGKSVMHDYGPFSRKNIINYEMPIQEKGEAIDIDCITMDAFLKEANVPEEFDLLLIDVEDGERDVLKSFPSLGRTYRPTAIIIETENGAEVKKIMSNVGYVRYCSFDTESPSTKNDVYISVKRVKEKFAFLDKLKKQKVIHSSEINP
jgi:FkbM family methyltransferase